MELICSTIWHNLLFRKCCSNEQRVTGWWFEVFFIFTSIWGRFPSWQGLKPPTIFYTKWWANNKPSATGGLIKVGSGYQLDSFLLHTLVHLGSWLLMVVGWFLLDLHMKGKHWFAGHIETHVLLTRTKQVRADLFRESLVSDPTLSYLNDSQLLFPQQANHWKSSIVNIISVSHVGWQNRSFETYPLDPCMVDLHIFACVYHTNQPNVGDLYVTIPYTWIL